MKTTPKTNKRKLEYMKKYQQRPEIKAHTQEYHRGYNKLPEKRKHKQEYERKYYELHQKRKDRQRDYWKTLEYKQRKLERYLKNHDKILKQQRNRFQLRYKQDPEFKKRISVRDARRRLLGYASLNQEFEGSEGHHIDKEHVVFIPKLLHRSVWHSLNNLETMEQINTKVFCWLLGKSV